jgi:hypothetical protein
LEGMKSEIKWIKCWWETSSFLITRAVSYGLRLQKYGFIINS